MEPHLDAQLPEFSVPIPTMVFDWEKNGFSNQEQQEYNVSMDPEEEDTCSLVDSMLCDSTSKLITSGFTRSTCTDCIMFVNAGGEAAVRDEDCSMNILSDSYYQGGDTFRTDEHISAAGDYPFIYHSARLGNFCYQFRNLASGYYLVDLHFVEIINTNGPKGMRVFNVYMQEEKVLSEFDVFSIVGANKPLQLIDKKVIVKEDGEIRVRFEGVIGSPLVSGICLRRVSDLSAPEENLRCKKCSAEIDFPNAQKKCTQVKAKYEKKIEELQEQCRLKTEECYQAWMSLTAANEHLEKVRMDLDNKLFKTYSLDQAVEEQAEKLKNVSGKYEHDKKFWAEAVKDLEGKLKIMKQEHFQLSREAHECAGSIPELNKMVSAVQDLVAQCEDLKVKYCEEQEKRKKLYNQVQEAKGNIRVFCRCRPLNKEEISSRYTTAVDFDAAVDGDLGILTGGSGKKIFKFDRVYTPKDNQADVFADAEPLVVSVLDGYNVCIFAYGQTGTGKTFTMEGTEQNRGVNYRTLERLFAVANERKEFFKYNISVSVLEVYNEQIRDLLATSANSKKLEIKQAFEGSHHVPGIVEAKVESINEVWSVLQAGSSARAVGSNNVNEHSSRSHCMLSIMVRAQNLMTGECTKSKLWLVDLAGSERLAKTDAQGDRLKEAQNINRSLSALGDVISALAAKNSHIPYRNSKLTHLLQDSLGGDSKTLMFVQISPSENDLGETLSSLNFATRVRGVELGPARKHLDTGELQKMKTMLDKARQEVRSKDELLRKLEDSMQNMESKTRSKDQSNKNLQEKIKELEGLLESKAASNNQSEKQLVQLSERFKGKEEICSSLQHKVKELENKLREREQLESTTYQAKIKDLEAKLSEQIKESEFNSYILQQKVEELQRKLKEMELNPESVCLHRKIKELEDKLMEQKQNLDTVEVLRATLVQEKSGSGVELMAEDSNILRTINSGHRKLSHGSNTIKATEPLHERRKRDSRSGETENINHYVNNGKKVRQSDPPPKPFAVRTVRPVTTTKPAAVAQRVVVNRVNRDQAQIVKDKDAKKRMWSR